MDGEEEFIEKAVEGWCSASSTRGGLYLPVAGADP
jgi:hypothetical protein